MPWRGPEWDGDFPSLGWGVVQWVTDHLRVPSGRFYNQPLVLSDEQVAFVVRCYRLVPATKDDAVRRYRRACLRRIKGWGKSPLAGALAIAELAGPVTFDGWDAEGEPVGRPHRSPVVQLLAVSEDQAEENTYAAVFEMLAAEGVADGIGVDLGKKQANRQDGPGILGAVTSAAESRQGGLPTFAVMDETHLWFRHRGGHKLASAVRQNLAKTGGWSLETTNAHEVGQDSVAERTFAAAEDGQDGLLFDSRDVPDVVTTQDEDDLYDDPDAMRAAIVHCYGDSIAWNDPDRVSAEVYDVDTTKDDALRFFANRNRKGASQAFDPRQWAEHADPSRTPTGGDVPVVVMFDGARTRDCAVITAWTIEERPHHFEVASWVRPPITGTTNYEHPRGEIRAAVREAFDELDVVMLVYDSSFHELDSLYDEWIEEWGDGRVVGFATAAGQRMERAIKRIREDVRVPSAFTHAADPLVDDHIANAVLTRNRGGWQALAKPTEARKIDAAVCVTFGYEMIPAARVVLTDRGPAYAGPLIAAR